MICLEIAKDYCEEIKLLCFISINLVRKKLKNMKHKMSVFYIPSCGEQFYIFLVIEVERYKIVLPFKFSQIRKYLSCKNCRMLWRRDIEKG